MKNIKPHVKRGRPGTRSEQSSISPIAVDKTLSSPDFSHAKGPGKHKGTEVERNEVLCISPSDNCLGFEWTIGLRKDSKVNEILCLDKQPDRGDDTPTTSHEDMMPRTPNTCVRSLLHPKNLEIDRQKIHGSPKIKADKCCEQTKMPKKSWSTKSPRSSEMDTNDPLLRLLQDVHHDTRKSAKIIRDSKAKLINLQKKAVLNEADIKELGERNELLLREMERFDRLTKTIQKLVGAEVEQFKKFKGDPFKHNELSTNLYEPMFPEFAMCPAAGALGAGRHTNMPGLPLPGGAITRSKSEIDLTRKLTESYDMQEKLVADNADLEVKRYILYKELMTKDQNLETCRAQIKRLQGELKLLNIENSILSEKLDKNNPEGDATAINQDVSCQQKTNQIKENFDEKSPQDLIERLDNYKSSSVNFEKQLGELELEVRHIRAEMASKKNGESACRGGSAVGPNTCFQQQSGGGPPVPPMTKACGVCPPCPAPCNPNAPPTPAEKEVQKLTIQLTQMQESFKTKVAECAMLRTELLKKKEELEKERCQHREVGNKLRELEMKFEGLTTHTNMLLGTREEAFEQEVSVRMLKQCYREAREEIDELRVLMKEQNDQLQDYRVKYLQAQQLVEEQKRQMDMMDMDNTRISEQINLEIQKVKLKFQEKLQELAPIPDLLKATQMKLKDAQQSQAIAEHNAEQLARELNCAREKVHVLLHNTIKPPEKAPEKGTDEKQIALLQQRISQLTETNISLKSEIERLKANVIRMEEAVLAHEKRLHEKMHECAQLGGELDRYRDEAARALQRANERTETVRKCMQTTVAELERQLAASRANVKNAEKEREEVQCRMQCQIKRLNENFEQAQLRILGLQGQVQALRHTASSDGEGEGDGDVQACACKEFLGSP
ncbi:early endosome antigen 1 [Papilio machaon]|uniref:early endosome antigen 1 n=1 Tax=Papilio machaon TaxID=76193 RepID=UPI001E663A79|nr:early endosome antigen 1 [Papilio machaon]